MLKDRILDKNVSEYARFFDFESSKWLPNMSYNLMFLTHIQQHCNDLLRHRGYLFLNEVYEMLGMPKTKAGRCVGWIYDEEKALGDNYVDFAIYSECNSDAINGVEKPFLLDFNVDGVMDFTPYL